MRVRRSGRHFLAVLVVVLLAAAIFMTWLGAQWIYAEDADGMRSAVVPGALALVVAVVLWAWTASAVTILVVTRRASPRGAVEIGRGRS